MKRENINQAKQVLFFPPVVDTYFLKDKNLAKFEANPTHFVEEDDVRGVNRKIMKNKGLTRKRGKKHENNSRVKHKHKYEKAQIKQRVIHFFFLKLTLAIEQRQFRQRKGRCLWRRNQSYQGRTNQKYQTQRLKTPRVKKPKRKFARRKKFFKRTRY